MSRSGRLSSRWRIAAALLLAVVGLFGSSALAACSSGVGEEGEQYVVASGGTAGIYYGYGHQLAEALHRELGIDIEVAETHGSVDNLRRVGAGAAFLGFAQGDTAADAAAGEGIFDEPLPIRTVARVYDEYVHVVVADDSDVQRIEDLAGHAVSLGAPNSGVNVIARRVLEAADVPLDAVTDLELALDDSIEAMQAGEIEGFFWVGGLPTPGIEVLEQAMPIRLLSVPASIVERVNEGHAGVYRLADFPLGIYGVDEHAVTMTVPNYLVTSEGADEKLVYEAVRVLFESRPSIARKIAAAEVLDRRQAIFTAPVELHPGAAEYYIDSRR